MKGRFFSVLVLVATVLTVGACDSESQRLRRSQEIRDVLRDAHSCEVPADCVPIGSPCPFGCSVTANKKDAPHLLQLIDQYNRDYPERCVYKCMRTEGVDCIAGRCQATIKCNDDAHCGNNVQCGVEGRPICVMKSDGSPGGVCGCAGQQ